LGDPSDSPQISLKNFLTILVGDKMKSDIVPLMKERGVDAVVVLGTVANNPSMYYVTDGAELGEATVAVLTKNGERVLFHSPIEADNARKVKGFRRTDLSKYDFRKYLDEAGGRYDAARAEWMLKMLRDAGVRKHAKVSFFGRTEAHGNYPLIDGLRRRGLRVRYNTKKSLLSAARETKGPEEMKRIRVVAQKTDDIYNSVIDYIRVRRRGDTFVNDDGRPLTVGDVKRYINVRMAENDLVDTEGTIFAPGSDGAGMHSRGKPKDVIKLGVPIVFDFFPEEKGGGYYFDMTRTFCLGWAPGDVADLYDLVLDVQNQVIGALKAGTPAEDYQRMTCELFEKAGHKTIGDKKKHRNGYLHSIGHGLGLNINEKPFFYPRSGDFIRPGSVFTVEPGLYYRGKYGVRIEDVIYMSPTGGIENLTRTPKQLVIEV
jgi:Xaa-Pro aminopeptidase